MKCTVLKVDYNISSKVILTTLTSSNRVYSIKPNNFYFYEKFLEIGARFPLHPFIYSILSHFKIAFRQLMPNF